jgi:hypothetical protein
LLGAARNAPAVDLGVRGGYYFDRGDPFLGFEVITPVARRIYFNPNLEWVFAGEGQDFLTINADFHYDFPVQGPTFVWAGAGLGLLWSNPEGPDNSDLDPALNLLAGVGFRTGHVVPFFQTKLILDGGSEFALAFGVRF